MAGQVIITFAAPLSRSQDGGIQVIDAHAAQTEELTSAASSAATTITANARDVAYVRNEGSAGIWVEFGASPTAAVETTHWVPATSDRAFGGLGSGDKCAIIDDS